MTIRRRRIRRPRVRPRAGLTIVELLVSIFILAAAVVGTASVVMATTTTQVQSSMRAEMTDLGISKLEQVRTGLDNNDATVIATLGVGGSLTTAVAGYSDVVTSPSGRSYQRLWLIEDGASITRKITIRVQPSVANSRFVTSMDFVTLVMGPF